MHPSIYESIYPSIYEASLKTKLTDEWSPLDSLRLVMWVFAVWPRLWLALALPLPLALTLTLLLAYTHTTYVKLCNTGEVTRAKNKAFIYIYTYINLIVYKTCVCIFRLWTCLNFPVNFKASWEILLEIFAYKSSFFHWQCMQIWGS